MRDPKVAGSGNEAVNKSLGETETPCTSTFSFLSKPSLLIVFNMPMNSFPRPYLKLTFLASIFCGISTTSSCSTLTHSTGPMPSGKSNICGSEKGLVVNQPLPSSQTKGGFKHSSMVVQIENEGAKESPSITMLEPSKTVNSSIWLKSSSEAYFAKTSLRPGSIPIPTTAQIFLSAQFQSRANCSSPNFTPTSVCGYLG